MKCQNCGRNEATYYYKSSINGRVTETRLCACLLYTSDAADEL